MQALSQLSYGPLGSRKDYGRGGIPSSIHYTFFEFFFDASGMPRPGEHLHGISLFASFDDARLERAHTG